MIQPLGGMVGEGTRRSSFLLYGKRGGSRTSPLPDLYIGTHAAIEHLALLTRGSEDNFHFVFDAWS
jgi:hypothetical protein